LSFSATDKINGSYIDRKVAEGIFRELLGERPPYRVMNVYGNSGMGKSHFKKYIKARYLEKSDNLIYIELNFKNRLLHKPHSAIMHLAKELEARYDFNFMSLWKAYAILWQKRYEHSPIMYAADLPYFHEIKKLLRLDKNGKPVIEIAKGLFSDTIYKELQELQELDSQTIEARLYKFFANDLRNIIKSSSFKDCVIIFDNVDLLSEHIKGTPCAKDEWIRELITQVGKEAMFMLFSQADLNWKACNAAWKDVVKSYKMDVFAKKDAIRYLSESGFKNSDLKEAIAISSGNEPFYLSFAKYAYSENRSYYLPTTKKDIFNAFFENEDARVVQLLKILTQARFFTTNIVKLAGKEFGIAIDEPLIEKLLNYDFVKAISKNRYTIDSILKDELQKHISDTQMVDYKAFMFSYWENILQSLDMEIIKSTPQIIDEAIEEAWYHLNTINSEPLVHFEWLDYYVARFFMYAAWEPFVDRYNQIMPKLQNANDTVSQEKLVSLYNNLAGLYESLGESKKAKAYYGKVLELSRLELLSA